MSRRGRGLVALLATLVMGVVGSAPAHAATRCIGTRAGGASWQVVQAHTNCTFARYAVRLVVDRRRSPVNWRCYVKTQAGEFDPERKAVRVRCVRGDKRVVGVAR